MNILFRYDRAKDVWCLLNKGKSSNNSPTPTKVYEQLVAAYGENPTEENTSLFIDSYLLENDINVDHCIEAYCNDWGIIASEFIARAETIFGITLKDEITAYLTVNNRCPYSFEENYFYVSLSGQTARKTIIHELWHFYTWHGLGADQEERLGKQKFNDLKESLTVLLNVECADLFPEGTQDKGYPQHQEMREKILEYWEKDKNIKNLWEYLITV